MIQFNPFVIEGYLSPEYFCDRREETALLIEHLTNQRNVSLIAKRRLGKSGLIHHCFAQPLISENYYTFYVDIYDTKNLAELTFELGKCILSGLKSTGRKSWEGFINVLKSLKSSITFDINGIPEWSISMGEIVTPDITLDEIFTYLEHADKPCIVAIDEFQTIADYQEKTVEATLRKRIQNCHNVHFVYSGSKRHMMTEMFLTKSRPFYNSSVMMGLEAIDEEEYFTFANSHFAYNAQSISKEAFSYLYQKYEGTTWNIQYILNVLYTTKSSEITFQEKDIETATETILQRNTFAYKSLLYQLSPKQKHLLYAIAKEGKAQSIMSQRFLNKHKMTSSAVQGALKVLLDRDFVSNDDGVYYVYDKFFELWLNSILSK
ncbi:MAG: ATP-binding protein [Prevotella sp.]|nr:ATP-binding protein [Candidatus Prevotella equi]